MNPFMQLSVSFPICRVNCRPDAVVLYSLPVLALLAFSCIAIAGFSLPLKIVLSVLAFGYAIISFQAYQKHASDVLESNKHGALFLVRSVVPQALEQVVWRDWGFLIELQASMQGKRLSKFWFCARLEYDQLRHLRLLMKAQNRKAGNCLPSIITNPVL